MKMIWEFLKQLVSDFHAWRRAERRIVPIGVRGRIYQRQTVPSDGMKAKASLKGKMSIRVNRAGTWYKQNQKTGLLEKE